MKTPSVGFADSSLNEGARYPAISGRFTNRPFFSADRESGVPNGPALSRQTKTPTAFLPSGCKKLFARFHPRFLLFELFDCLRTFTAGRSGTRKNLTEGPFSR